MLTVRVEPGSFNSDTAYKPDWVELVDLSGNAWIEFLGNVFFEDLLWSFNSV